MLNTGGSLHLSRPGVGGTEQSADPRYGRGRQQDLIGASKCSFLEPGLVNDARDEIGCPTLRGFRSVGIPAAPNKEPFLIRNSAFCGSFTTSGSEGSQAASQCPERCPIVDYSRRDTARVNVQDECKPLKLRAKVLKWRIAKPLCGLTPVSRIRIPLSPPDFPKVTELCNLFCNQLRAITCKSASIARHRILMQIGSISPVPTLGNASYQAMERTTGVSHTRESCVWLQVGFGELPSSPHTGRSDFPALL